jgi:hypothetical protein
VALTGLNRAPAKSRFVPCVRWPHIVGRRPAATLIQATSQMPATGTSRTFGVDRDFAGALVI